MHRRRGIPVNPQQQPTIMRHNHTRNYRYIRLSLSLSFSPFALFSLPSVIVSLIGIHAITKQQNQVLGVTLTGKVAHFSRGVIKTELALMFEKFLYDVSLFVVECLGKWCPSPSASKQM